MTIMVMIKLFYVQQRCLSLYLGLIFDLYYTALPHIIRQYHVIKKEGYLSLSSLIIMVIDHSYRPM